MGRCVANIMISPRKNMSECTEDMGMALGGWLETASQSKVRLN